VYTNKATAAKDIDELRAATPDAARLEIVPSAPHEVPMSNPDAVNALTLAFLGAP
jgi:pimeloyl-ACP methyl ester carboxylesterase